LTPTVILDSDFLSAFLKIDRLPLAREFYQVDKLWLPPAVYREVALTTLLPNVLAFSWVQVKAPSPGRVKQLLKDAVFGRLGVGEQEAIALTIEYRPAVLLVNDNQARVVAGKLGVNAVNVPAFLLACKLVGLLDRASMAQAVADLRAKDHYGFRQDVLDLLLA
jgi:predicted nucleic acid-binding protein